MDIGYFSFTKKAATEAKTRAIEKFKTYDEADFPYFRTLHSLAFGLLRLKKQQVMQTADYKDFGIKCGIPLNIKKASSNDEDGTFTSDNEYLQIIEKARALNMNVLDLYDQHEHHIDIERNSLYLIDRELKRYKKEKGLLDYGDMLQRFVESDLAPRFAVLFIDEAQDLSPLQWKLVRSLWERSDYTYLAGDDDQAIFKWAGADVDYFYGLREEVDTITVLDQSYRIPGGPIHKLANDIISRVNTRFEKNYKPRKQIGTLDKYLDVEQLDMSEGEWLVLASTNYCLDDIKRHCEFKGWYYSNRGRNAIPSDLLMAIQNWEQWRQGNIELNAGQIKNIYSYLGDSVMRGYKKGKTLKDELIYDIETCIADHGLISKDVWYNAFKKLDGQREIYIRNMLANKEKISKRPRITMSTIHGAKGGECDNVLLLQDISYAAVIQHDRNPDELHRLFYVGVTRTKEKLHILEPKDARRAYRLPV